MLFSICIPNFNYGRYLGETIRSVLSQTEVELEILVSDNASTDESLEVVKAFDDPRIQLQVNEKNLGFAANLDRVGSMARGDFMIMLSSDDLMKPTALSGYQSLLRALGPQSTKAVLSASWDIIDAQGKKTGSAGPDTQLWSPGDRVNQLESILNRPIYGVRGDEMLKRCLKRFRSPFNFAATCYPRSLYRLVAGYGANRLVNPDKWFHWKLLSVAEMAYFVDSPLFSYRWHSSNQNAIELNSGALKFLVDEYVSTLELDSELLARLGLSRKAVINFFLENDILNHGLATLARGSRTRAKRILRFGEAVYPDELRASLKRWLLRSFLCLGPLGQYLASRLYARHVHAIAGPTPVGS
jgi:glycosyltransferase involved in cell wall biosynthesis